MAGIDANRTAVGSFGRNMLASIIPVRSLILAIFVLMSGAGFLSTFVSLRLEAAGTASLMIGLAGTAYFAGLTVGSLRIPMLLRRVGHIRAFAAFVSLLSASILAYSLWFDVGFWTFLRFIDGLCIAGVFVCLESWLNEQADQTTRGGILAGYMIALYSGQAIGQFLLSVGGPGSSIPYVISSLLVSISLIPVALTRTVAPPLPSAKPFALGKLYESSPLGLVGAAATGLMLGAFYSLGAVFARSLGLAVEAIASFMSAVIIGGVVLQWPLGRLSDIFDRRRVIVFGFAGTVMASGALVAFASPGLHLLLLGGLFGGLSFALYPLCVAHTNDQVPADERVAATGGLVLLYSVGAAAGPMAGAAAMTFLGADGLFMFIALCSGAALLFGLWRQIAAMPVPSELQRAFLLLPRTTPMSALLDPLGHAARRRRSARKKGVDDE